MPNWVLEALEALTLASDMKLLCWLARHGGYRQSTFSSKQLAIALEIDLRTTQAGLARLAAAGHVLSADGQHCVRNAAARLPQGFYKSTRVKTGMEPRQEKENASLNLKNCRTDELEELKNKKEEHTPLPPQGEARNPAALSEVLPEVQVKGGSTPTPEALPAAGEPAPAASASNAKGPGKVPRRAAELPIPPLPADLAALAGVSEAWDCWLVHRQERKLATPPTTAEAQFAKLRQLHAAGQDLPTAMKHAMEVQWKSFFPIKSDAQQRENLKFQPPRPATAAEKAYEERYS